MATPGRGLNSWQALTRAALCGAYKYSGAMRAHEWAARLCGRRFLSILLFHRVTDVIPEDGLTISTRRFGRICRLLADRFHVVPLEEVFALLRGGAPLPARTLAITFDDCYHNNLDAARCLARYRLPATFFIPTAYVGTCRAFDWDRGLPKLPNLSWDDVRAIADLGFDIGSHTVSHANLGMVTIEQARMELGESRDVLERQLRRPVRWFAYPYGGKQHLRPEYVPLIREAGYEGAVSAYGGFVWPGMDAEVLPREAVPYFRSLSHLELYLAGCLNWFYALKGKAAQEIRTPWPYPAGTTPPAGVPAVVNDLRPAPVTQTSQS